jgi:hypothetical protein
MLVAERKYIEEVHVLLQEGVDFTAEDLQPNKIVAGKMSELPATKLSEIAFNYGFMEWTWAGHYDTDSKTVKATFQKPIFIDTESNKVMMV